MAAIVSGKIGMAMCLSAQFWLYVMVEALLVGSVGTATMTAENSGGFAVTRFPSLNLFALQCNGSHLPSDVRSVQHISLQRYSHSPDVPNYIIASLSSVDGVRLENSQGNQNMYVNGVFDVDNIQATSLTVLLNDVSHEVDDVTYGCTISYTKRGGMLQTIQRTLNVTALDIQNMYRVDKSRRPDSGEEMEETDQPPLVASSAQSGERKPYWNTPLILLIAMAGLLFILFVVCLLLVVDRCKETRRQRKRADRLSKKKSGSKESQTLDQEARPLPSPPQWTYPPGTAVPPYKSPYHRLRVGAGARSVADDTGYDSDASMHYCRPYDDIGEVIAEKTALETFGRPLPLMYNKEHIMAATS